MPFITLNDMDLNPIADQLEVFTTLPGLRSDHKAIIRELQKRLRNPVYRSTQCGSVGVEIRANAYSICIEVVGRTLSLRAVLYSNETREPEYEWLSERILPALPRLILHSTSLRVRGPQFAWQVALSSEKFRQLFHHKINPILISYVPCQ